MNVQKKNGTGSGIVAPGVVARQAVARPTKPGKRCSQKSKTRSKQWPKKSNVQIESSSGGASGKQGAAGKGHYAMLAKRDTARLITITKTQQPAIVQHTMSLTASHRKYAESIYPAVAEAMQTGLYLPRRASYLCSRKHCAFWRHCEAEHGGQVMRE